LLASKERLHEVSSKHIKYFNEVNMTSFVVSTKDTTLTGRISDVVRPERGTDFVAYKE
jgi:hypothetical protein